MHDVDDCPPSNPVAPRRAHGETEGAATADPAITSIANSQCEPLIRPPDAKHISSKQSARDGPASQAIATSDSEATATAADDRTITFGTDGESLPPLARWLRQAAEAKPVASAPRTAARVARARSSRD